MGKRELVFLLAPGFSPNGEEGDFNQFLVLVRAASSLQESSCSKQKSQIPKQSYFHAEGGSIEYRHHPAPCKLALGQQSHRSSRFLMARAVVCIRENVQACFKMLLNWGPDVATAWLCWTVTASGVLIRSMERAGETQAWASPKCLALWRQKLFPKMWKELNAWLILNHTGEWC